MACAVMDRYFAAFAGRPDDDLTICDEAGVAYQTDMTVTAAYDQSYFNKCAGYEGQEICDKINQGRIEMVNAHVGRAPVLDIGVGSGEFVRRRPLTWGYDINPAAMHWLVERGLWANELHSFRGYTMWDVIEHVPEPDDYFQHIAPGSYLFTSVPIFEDMNRIRESRHYRPGEHLLYFTEPGLLNWMALHGFECRQISDFETVAGRDSIRSYAFLRKADSI